MKTYIVKLQCYRDETSYSSHTEYVTAESSKEARELQQQSASEMVYHEHGDSDRSERKHRPRESNVGEV